MNEPTQFVKARGNVPESDVIDPTRVQEPVRPPCLNCGQSNHLVCARYEVPKRRSPSKLMRMLARLGDGALVFVLLMVAIVVGALLGVLATLTIVGWV